MENESSGGSSRALLYGLMKTFDLLDSMPSIVFPRPAGVNKTVEFLSSQGFRNIQSCESLRDPLVDYSKAVESEVAGWKSTPIYVIKEWTVAITIYSIQVKVHKLLPVHTPSTGLQKVTSAPNLSNAGSPCR
jgi:hypothetical protein